MEDNTAIYIDSNHSKPSQYIVPTFSDLISETLGYQVVPSDTNDAMGASSRSCRSLAKAINSPLVHSSLPENYPEFLDGVLPQYPPVRYNIDQVSSQEIDYSYPTLPPSFLFI